VPHPESSKIEYVMRRLRLRQKEKTGYTRRNLLHGNLNLGEDMARRTFLAQLAGLPFLALGMKPQDSKKPLNIMMKGAWGPDDPTRAAFPFLHGLALSEAGHNVQIYLLSDATSLLRKSTANAIFPVGWPPLSETLAKVVAKHIPIYSCGACSRARDITEADLNLWGAKFGSPPIFVSMVEWADRIIVE
jgi:predicted peroxiredoxin